MHQLAEPECRQNADGAPRKRKEGGLRKELLQYVASVSAQRLAYADFTCALSNGYQHHIHDHYAADNQRNGRDPYSNNRDGPKHLLTKMIDSVGGHDAEVIRIVVFHMPSGPEDQADFILRLIDLIRANGFDLYRNAVS